MIKKKMKKKATVTTESETKPKLGSETKRGTVDRDRAAKMMSYGTGSGRMEWMIGKEYWIRILPLHDEILGSPFAMVPETGCITYPVHRGLSFKDGQGEWKSYIPFLCRDNVRDEKKCPACIYSRYASGSGDPTDKKDSAKLRLEAHHMANIYVRSEEQVFRQRFNHKVASAILSVATEYGDITDLSEGLDIRIRIGRFGRNPTLEFVMPARQGSEFEDPDIMDSLEPVTKSLEFVKVLTRKGMCKKLVKKFGPIPSHPWFKGE